jgi:hypothetical protein
MFAHSPWRQTDVRSQSRIYTALRGHGGCCPPDNDYSLSLFFFLLLRTPMARREPDPIPTERLTWDAGRQAYAPPGAGAARERARFLKGPIPWEWVIAAAALPGRALEVGLCLWRLAGATRSATVTFGNADLVAFGIDRAAKSRALAALEEANLIGVEREPGRFPVVTLPVPVRRPGSKRRGTTSKPARKTANQRR